MSFWYRSARPKNWSWWRKSLLHRDWGRGRFTRWMQMQIFSARKHPCLRIHLHLTIAYQIIPITPPSKIAVGAVRLNHIPPTKLVAVITTNQGSASRLLPFVNSSLTYPIRHNRYTAVYTKPTAEALIPRRRAVTQRCLRMVFQMPTVAVWRIRPGRKMPR